MYLNGLCRGFAAVGGAVPALGACPGNAAEAQAVALDCPRLGRVAENLPHHGAQGSAAENGRAKDHRGGVLDVGPGHALA